MDADASDLLRDDQLNIWSKEKKKHVFKKETLIISPHSR